VGRGGTRDKKILLQFKTKTQHTFLQKKENEAEKRSRRIYLLALPALNI